MSILSLFTIVIPIVNIDLWSNWWASIILIFFCIFLIIIPNNDYGQSCGQIKAIIRPWLTLPGQGQDMGQGGQTGGDAALVDTGQQVVLFLASGQVYGGVLLWPANQGVSQGH